MTRTANSHIKRRTGIYHCASCKRLTRNTGAQASSNSELCPECDEIAGLENGLADGYFDSPEEEKKMEDRVSELTEKARSKGGIL